MPSCFAAGGSLAGSHLAFFLSLSAPLSATVDRQIPAATRALRIVPMPRSMRTQFLIRLFMGPFQPKKAAASKTIAVRNGPGHGEFKNGSRRRKKADFGAK